MEASAILATIVSAALYYGSLRHQRWFSEPLPLTAARTSAALAAIVALRAWIEVLPIVSAIVAWLAALALASLIVAAAGRPRRR